MRFAEYEDKCPKCKGSGKIQIQYIVPLLSPASILGSNGLFIRKRPFFVLSKIMGLEFVYPKKTLKPPDRENIK